jgi:serine/threonine protein kinase
MPIDGDEAVLVDFSIAKEYIPDSTTTANRHGSPGYAAPEQYATGTTPRTDIYGLGATLYTLLTGVVPADALTRLTTSKGDPLQPVVALVPDIPMGVSDAIRRAMSLNHEQRFESVEQFWQEIHTYANEKQAAPAEITSLSTAHPERTRVRPLEDTTTESLYEDRAIPVVRSRRIPLLLITFLLIVALIAGVLYYTLDYHKSVTILSNATPTVSHAVVATHTSATSTFPYPPLANAYNGTISDWTAKSKTDLRLANIQQEKGNIRGSFQGLGMTGLFEGTVDTAEHIHFTIPIYTGKAVLVFNGVIKIGGVMAGDFNVQNTNGQPTGEYGLWSAAPVK